MARAKVQRTPRRRPTKGALIRGASQLLPRELLFEPTFREELRGLMRGYSGLYVLYKRKSLYYIGLANDAGRFSRMRPDGLSSLQTTVPRTGLFLSHFRASAQRSGRCAAALADS